MKIEKHVYQNEIIGYTMKLDANDVQRFSQKWPGCTVPEGGMEITVDKNGLVDIYPQIDIPGHELDAIVCDNMIDEIKHLWPTWDFN